MKSNEICFFTYVNEKYYHFVTPLLFSIVKNVPDCKVEIVVENHKDFYDKYGKQIANLFFKDVSFLNNNLIRNLYYHELYKDIIPNTKRFLLQPITKVNFTYIIDCDMLITKKLFDKAVENNIIRMKELKTCFFNIKRENRNALSGVHFVETKKYFPKLSNFLKLLKENSQEDFTKIINAQGDEGFLYNFVAGTWGDPEKLTKDNVRFLPGEHISSNRGKKYTPIKEELCKDEDWKFAFSQFDKKFLELF